MFEDWKWHHTRRDNLRDPEHAEQPARVAQSTTTTPRQCTPTVSYPLSVEAIMAGFIAWMAHHHSPLIQRGRYADAVERFLRWQRNQRERHASHLEDDYYAHMQRAGSTLPM
ncbi:MAG: hypothetical protein QOE32_3406 [Pseudonocardiales bacterium]|nr:hypothetical protein [Pseudonocardiales bacterium]